FRIVLSYTEENYIKAIFHLSGDGEKEVFTNDISEELSTKPASVTDMMKKLSLKELVNYKKYQGVTLTKSGRTSALKVIRKHRLWEVFLVEKLNFNWDEVHDIAEQLEHIQSNLLIERLDNFLGNPAYDPHGDPIPNVDGKIKLKKMVLLSDVKEGFVGEVACLKETSSAFLKYLDKIGIKIGTNIKVNHIVEFDASMDVTINKSKTGINISNEVSKNIFVSL
ncbi:MAG TPA: metal-dependent transcriptional regulator, partial [Cytophagaceae bacterium]|nr:metal-dependent transcriptional regulator [Cytophagaceae bacterium]